MTEVNTIFLSGDKDPLPLEIGARRYAVFYKPDEFYAGILLGKDGEPDQHVILLPEKAVDLTWDEAMKFASDIGGDLPTRREQSLLFANLKEQFEERWYWSGTQHSDDSDFAWFQTFFNGNQFSHHKGYQLRARFVRRSVI